jgi:hypothetical protein
MIRYDWLVKHRGLQAQEHRIQLQLDTFLRFFGTGSGRLLVDGDTVCHWGCNPFRMIPKGSCEFEIEGSKASVKSRLARTGLFFLVLDEREIPPLERRRRESKVRRNR